MTSWVFSYFEILLSTSWNWYISVTKSFILVNTIPFEQLPRTFQHSFHCKILKPYLRRSEIHHFIKWMKEWVLSLFWLGYITFLEKLSCFLPLLPFHSSTMDNETHSGGGQNERIVKQFNLSAKQIRTLIPSLAVFAFLDGCCVDNSVTTKRSKTCPLNTNHNSGMVGGVRKWSREKALT